MKITKLNIVRFGKLKNIIIDLSEGLNIFVDRNGSGKSTTAAFIKAMLYGFDYNRSDSLGKKLHEKYKTWDSTDKFGGSLFLEYKGNEYEVSRYFGSTRIQEELKVINLKDNTLSKVFDKGLGETLFNLDSAGFDRCFFVPQYEVSLTNNDTVINRLSNLIEDSSEINCEKAVKRLDSKRSELRKQGSDGGKLTQVETEIRITNSKILKTQTDYEEIAKNDEIIGQAKIKLTQIDTKLKVVAEEFNQLEQLRQSDTSSGELEFYTTQANNAQAECVKLSQEIKIIDVDEQQLQTISSKISEYSSLENSLFLTQSKSFKHIPFIASAALIIACIIFAIIGSDIFIVLSVICGTIAVGLLCFELFKPKAKTNPLQDKQQQILKFLDNYFDTVNVQFAMELSSRYDKYHKSLKDYNYAQSLLSQATDKITQINIRRTSSQFNMQKYNDTRINLENITNEKSQLNQQLTRLISSNETSLKYVDNLSNLQAYLEDLKETREKLILEIAAYYCSIELLYQAKKQLSTRYIPSMCKELSQQISYITNGEWSSVEVGGDLNPDNITLVEKDKRRNIDYFSKGIKEICLFTLRLGLAKQLYSDNIPLLILDDPFVNYDEEKFNKVCQMLKDISKSTQIILFSCHERCKLLKV